MAWPAEPIRKGEPLGPLQWLGLSDKSSSTQLSLFFRGFRFEVEEERLAG
jgi:hypothetical protein